MKVCGSGSGSGIGSGNVGDVKKAWYISSGFEREEGMKG